MIIIVVQYYFHLVLRIFFIHSHIGSFVKLCAALVAILDFWSTHKTYILLRTIQGRFQQSVISNDSMVSKNNHIISHRVIPLRSSFKNKLYVNFGLVG